MITTPLDQLNDYLALEAEAQRLTAIKTGMHAEWEKAAIAASTFKPGDLITSNDYGHRPASHIGKPLRVKRVFLAVRSERVTRANYIATAYLVAYGFLQTKDGREGTRRAYHGLLLASQTVDMPEATS